MQTARALTSKLETGVFAKTFSKLYPENSREQQKNRYIKAILAFEEIYGKDREITFISAPGRTEIGGNHTDHQRGRVLAASVNLDIICTVSKNDNDIVRIKSEGYNEDVVDVNDLSARENEKNKAVSLIRGVLARFKEFGYKIGGFDAYTTSDVLKGSGLSSSAAFEVAIGTILSHVFNGGKIAAAEIARIGQYAENVYFGKPSGLMDQMASSVGGFVAIDFRDPVNPAIEPVTFDFAHSGHTLCIVDTKGSHSDLTGEYAAIPVEMKKVAQFFGKEYLREINVEEFYEKLPEIRGKTGDRPVLRAMHFLGDNARVEKETSALKAGNFDKFKELVIESGRSSQNMLQNVFAITDPQNQGVSIALAVSESILSGKGAWRVHGGGFAGTIQAFVPNELLASYRAEMERLFGEGSCYELTVRPVGGIEVREDINNG